MKLSLLNYQASSSLIAVYNFEINSQEGGFNQSQQYCKEKPFYRQRLR
jgi:hypothetical protein